MVEPLLQPATSEGEEAADEVIQVLEDKAAPVAELNAPADAPAATESKAWSLSLGNPHNNENAFRFHLCFVFDSEHMANGVGTCAAEP